MVGLEEGLLPHSRSLESEEETEEERRLCYVGITRAKENLFLSCSSRRRFQGVYGNAIKSRFLDEIPKNVLKSELKKKIKQNFHWKSNFDKPNPYRSKDQEEPIHNVDLDFSNGDKIIHKHFGEGVLISHKVLSNDIELSIKFKNPYGIKKIMKNRAPISITSSSENLNPEDYYGI
jgi:DNA helicase-2/ATP-dependent DNA helicase PcrA